MKEKKEKTRMMMAVVEGDGDDEVALRTKLVSRKPMMLMVKLPLVC